MFVCVLLSVCPSRKMSDGLFLRECAAVAEDYHDIEFDSMIIDNCCMQVSGERERGEVCIYKEGEGGSVGVTKRRRGEWEGVRLCVCVCNREGRVERESCGLRQRECVGRCVWSGHAAGNTPGLTSPLNPSSAVDPLPSVTTFSL